jgi:amino acid permease
MISLLIALFWLWIDAFANIVEPTFDKHYTAIQPTGIPYFFGVSCFVFEGNGLTLDIYNNMAHKKRDFNKALFVGITFATILFQCTGIFLYHAFAQFSSP